MGSIPPEGLRYVPEFVEPPEETRLLDEIRALAFSKVEMRGQVARRRVAHFGWLYGYESWRIEPGPPIPAALLPLRTRAAALVALEPDALAEVLVTHYPPGAGIGWHRDAPQFGVVIGVSFLGACRMRFQRGTDDARETRVIDLARRSAYVIDGEARYCWQHTIPPAKTERYSVTFRTLRPRGESARTAPRS